MHLEHLMSAGLTEGEAIIYDYLLKNGEVSAGEIIKYTNLKRGNTYNILDSLIAKGIVSHQEKNKVAHFRIENPRALLDYIDRDRHAIENKKHAVESILPSLISHYQLNTHKPVVSYYEGDDGIEKVMSDTLNSKTELLQYMDYDAIQANIETISKNYLAKRKERGLNKKIISLRGPKADAYYKEKREFTDVKFIDRNNSAFNVSMHIYDDKVSYFSFADDKKIGVIIEDKKIADMHRTLFLDLFGRL